MDVRVEANHLLGCSVARRVCVEAAGHFITAIENEAKPGRAGACSRGGDADAVRMKHVTANGIDGGFAEYDAFWAFGTEPEVAGVPSRA